MTADLRHSQVRVTDGALHVIESGPVAGEPIVFLHTWPQNWAAWTKVIDLAEDRYRCIAIDLPGIGGSEIRTPNGEKLYLAGIVHELVTALGLTDVTLVGHDAGGMVTYAYLKEFDDLRAAVILCTVVPGVAPWQQVLANPYVWHFAFHSIRELPELLVASHIREYFDYFYNVIASHPEALSEQSREGYVQAYRQPAALQQGFELYRALSADAAHNARRPHAVSVPVLYLRGAGDGGDMAEYIAGFEEAGLTNLSTGIIDGAGHFVPEEAPELLWTAIRDHLQ